MNQPVGCVAERVVSSLYDGFVTLEENLHAALVRHGISALRITVGAVFLGFGFLKFFPGVSPAQNLSIKTIELLTFGVVPWEVGLRAIAVLEPFIGMPALQALDAPGRLAAGDRVRRDPRPSGAAARPLVQRPTSRTDARGPANTSSRTSSSLPPAW
jgi:hypothetical protein